MKRLLLLPLLALAVSACSKSGGGSADLTTETDTISYTFGYDMGRSFRQQKVEVNPDAYLSGLKAGVAADTSIMTETKVQERLNQFFQQLQEKQREEQMKQGEASRGAGEKFLEENKAKEGVKVTASGLQYQVIKEGTGATPKPTDIVTVHYTGTLIDGKKFDSSVDRGQPATFPVNGVIPGWTEALQLMKVGAKYKLYIPSNLAYGPTGAGDVIPPNAVLIFEVELLGVQPAGSQPGGAR